MNNYATGYTASCGGDTIYICATTTGTAANGTAITPGSQHQVLVGDTAGLSGGTDGNAEYTMNLEHDEHHLYGSTRLGVAEHIDTIARGKFSAQVTTTTGSFANVVPVGSITTYDNELVAVGGSTSHTTGGGSVTTETIYEKPALKTYEYTNHLGNVLLTTSDRKLTSSHGTLILDDQFSSGLDSWTSVNSATLSNPGGTCGRLSPRAVIKERKRYSPR